MPSTSRRSPNATLVEQSAINEVSKALENLPAKAKEKLSLREAVDVLREQITAALDKGYSYEDIAGMLEKQGVSIAPSSLKHYLARSNRQLKAAGGGTTTRRRRTTKLAEAEAEDISESTVVTEPSESTAVAEPEIEATPKKRGRPAASAATAEKKTRTTAARTKAVPASIGTRKR